jgi:hypothetical protein
MLSWVSNAMYLWKNNIKSARKKAQLLNYDVKFMVSLKTHPEIEFLDNNSTEDSSLLLHASRPFYWRILQKNHTFVWF